MNHITVPSGPSRILLSGASGYIGGRLLPLLQQRGLAVRCLARRPELLRLRVPAGTEIVPGDVLDRAMLDDAMAGMETAYFLVHSMGAAGSFEDMDRVAATNFAEAARAAGVARIIYLGGLGDSDTALSTHLRSRQEVGEVLRQHSGNTEVIEFRASIVIGAGSASFEMIRALVERLPVMITPRWVSVLAQPIAIDDLLAYLAEALALPAGGHRIFEIGGRDAMSYRDIMRVYARQRGLRRAMIPVPVLTPHLSSLWLGLVTPLYAHIGRRLVDSLRHPTVVHDRAALDAFPVRPRGAAEAIALALRNEDDEVAQTSWNSAITAAGELRQWGGVRFHNRLVDSRSRHVHADPERVFRAITGLGGANGRQFANWRWRVEACEAPSRLLLGAEEKLPGRAWLEFDVAADGTGSVVRQTAVFDPLGLLGLAYWYAAYPLHRFVLAGMLRDIARSAAQSAVEPQSVRRPNGGI